MFTFAPLTLDCYDAFIRLLLRLSIVVKTDLAREPQMALKDWEATINQIVEEIKQEPQKSRINKLLIAWRFKLEKAPTSLRPFQIDEIVREVRNRISR